MKKIIAAIILTFYANFLAATTIVIYITPDFVIMAADSKGVYTDATTYKQTTSIVSKIYKTGNVYFSLAGLTSNSFRSFDVAKITAEEFRTNRTVRAAVDAIKLRVKEALLSYLNTQKTNNYTLFKKNIEGETYVTSIGVVTIVNNRPYAHIIGFRVIDGSDLKIVVEEESYPVNAKKDAVYYLGASEEINRYMNTIQKNTMPPVAFVEKLMNIQIKKTPELVGGPIDMIKITPKQTTWVRRKKSTPVQL